MNLLKNFLKFHLRKVSSSGWFGKMWLNKFRKYCVIHGLIGYLNNTLIHYRLPKASPLRKQTFSFSQSPELFQIPLTMKTVLIILINLLHKERCLKHTSEIADLWYRL